MAVYYLDPENGSDAANGLTFPNRVKSTSAAAINAAALAPGDEIRIIASPDPTSLGVDGTWTNAPNNAIPAGFITSSTNASPIVITKNNHNLVTGDTIIVYGHTINTNANGTWEVNVLTSSTFELKNADGSNSVGNGVGGATGNFRQINNCRILLASEVTKNITLCGNLKVNWTASANVTSSIITSDNKEGYGCLSLVIAAGFTTGKAAYYTLPSTLDLSAYQQVSFWIKNTVGTVFTNGMVTLKLCTDTLGDVVAHSIDIPTTTAINNWMPVIVNLGTNLNSAIRSIAFYVTTDNGAQTFLLDNIIACKAASDPASLSLQSLIGKNTGNEAWLGIQSVNTTRVLLDGSANTRPSTYTQGCGYAGTSETVTVYKREPIDLGPLATAATSFLATVESGTLGNTIKYTGGWGRTDMSTKVGQSYFSGQTGLGIGFLNTFNYIELSDCNFFRFTTGVVLGTAATTNCIGNSVTTKDINNNNLGVSTIGSSQTLTSFDVRNICCNLPTTANTNGGMLLFGSYITANVGSFFGNRRNLDATVLTNSNITVGLCATAFELGALLPVSKNNLTLGNMYGNANADISGDCVVRNTSLNSATPSYYAGTWQTNFVWSVNDGSVAGNSAGYFNGGRIVTDTIETHTTGTSWKLSPTNANITTNRPLPLKVATVGLLTGVSKTVSVWFRRTNTGLTGRLICYSGQAAGVSTVSSVMTAAADTWEELSVTLTSTENGVVEVYAECFGGTTYSMYVDDITIT